MSFYRLCFKIEHFLKLVFYQKFLCFQHTTVLKLKVYLWIIIIIKKPIFQKKLLKSFFLFSRYIITQIYCFNFQTNKKIKWAYINYKENNYGNFGKFKAVNISYIFECNNFEACISPLHDTDFMSNKKYPYKHCKYIDDSCTNRKTFPRFDTCVAQIQYLGGMHMYCFYNISE